LYLLTGSSALTPKMTHSIKYDIPLS